MRVFLSSYGGFSLAIPIACVSSITLFDADVHNANSKKIVVYSQGNNCMFISIPRLFGLPDVYVRHGIILKDGKDDDGNAKNKNILLTSEIECETDIPAEEIYPFPKTLIRIKYSFLFNGLSFSSYNRKVQTDSGEKTPNLTLLLNPEQLIKRMKRKNV